MREIKFRAWDKEGKEMLELVTVGCTRKDSWGSLYIKDNIINGFDHKNYAVMQSTGLKDKNGEEIFEGDFISELSEQGEDWANHILVEVVWHKVGFYGKEKGHEPEYPITEFVKGEVIGNIWENPELLEVAE